MIISTLHSLCNMFAVALVITGAVCEILARRNPEKQQWVEAGWTLFLAGAIVMALSVITGFVVNAQAFIPKNAEFASQLLKFSGIGTLVFVLVAIIFRLLTKNLLSNTETGVGARAAYLTLQVICMVLTLFTAILGIALVKEYGVGVKPLQHQEQYMPPPVQSPTSLDSGAAPIQIDTTSYIN